MKTKGRPRERGKAEECFREALTLDKNHFLSLLALASLMWHRNYCTQSEILLHTAINLHTEEEWLSWCILSQVYNAQGQTDNEKSCIRKAEVLYTSSHGNRNAYTAPHVLLSPLLKFPFSCGHLFLQENLPSSTVFFETGLFLLDLHLDIGNCHLQLGNYNAAKKVFLKLCQVEPTTSSWLGAAIAFWPWSVSP